MVDMALEECNMFNEEAWPLCYVLRHVLLDVTMWQRGTLDALLQNPQAQREPQPRPDSLHVYVDGSWNLQTTQMGCGVVVKDSSGCWVSGASLSHDAGSTFLAKVLALELGLTHCWELGIRSIVCYTDCANVVSVFQSEMDVGYFWAREEIARVRTLLQLDWQVVIAPVSRDKNTTSDMLAR